MDNKNFIERLSARCGIEAEKVERLVEDLGEIIGESIVEEDCVAIPSFGSFEAKKKMERVVVHPSSGRKLLVPPKLTISFRPSGALRQRVRACSSKNVNAGT